MSPGADNDRGCVERSTVKARSGLNGAGAGGLDMESSVFGHVGQVDRSGGGKVIMR